MPHGFTDEYPPAGTIIHTSGNPNVPYKASVLDVAHDHGLQTALVLGRGTLTTCAQSYDATNGAPDLVPPDNGRNKIDHAVVNDDFSSGIVDAFLPMITNATPCNYAFLHFSDANYNGHWYGWGSSNYFDTLQTVDAQLGRILTAIDQTPELAAPGQTALIVTADYGGQDSNHTAAELLPIYTIPIIVWGAGIAPGTDLYTIFANRADPGTNRLDYNAIWQPLRNGDTGNLALTLLGLPSIPGSTMIPMFPTQSPALSVRPTDAGARLEWTTAAAGYTLQTSDRLDSAAVWLPVTQGIVTNANQCIYEITPKAGPRFFRLSRP